MKSKPCVWVVEMLSEPERVAKWEPTVGISLNKDEGRWKLFGWKRNNQHDRFRLTKYVREEKRRGK